MAAGDILWEPTIEECRRTRMGQFMRVLSERHGFEGEWPAFHAWSCQQPATFWGEFFDLAGIKATQPARAFMSGTGMLGTRWFEGARLNYAAQLLARTDERPAIIADDERGRIRRITWPQLHRAVADCQAALRQLGVQPGDRVAACMPNIPEAVIGMLACTALGATWSSCSPDFGVAAIVDRFGQIGPRVLITVDGYTYNGKRIELLDRVPELRARITGVEAVVVVPFLDEDPPLVEAVSWSNLLASARSQPLHVEAVPFDHPLFIMFSSGTTGVPKCIVHGHGGTLLQHMKELMLHCDVGADDTVFYFTTCGWMMWNWVASTLATGATLAMFEGSPSHPDLSRLWRFAEQAGVTVLGTSPKFLGACAQEDVRPAAVAKLSRLRVLLSTGAPLSAELFEWSYRHIRQRMQLSSICGGTDIISCFMLGNPILPVRSGEIQCLGLGMDVHAFDDAGQSVIGQRGELVCCTPFPSQPVCFWDDPDRARYRSTYFERYPDVWHHGDYVEITAVGGVIVHGRSDATLNPGGIRIGTAEIYRLVEGMDEVTDSIVIGRRAGDDVEVCLFVVLADGVVLTPELTQAIRGRIAAGASRRHVPAHIFAVSDIPYTVSGKKVEMAVAQVVHGEAVRNRDTLANPESLTQFQVQF